MSQEPLSPSVLQDALETGVRTAFAELIPNTPYVHDACDAGASEACGQATNACIVAVDGPQVGTLAIMMKQGAAAGIAQHVINSAFGEGAFDSFPQDELESLIEGSLVELGNRLASALIVGIPPHNDFHITFPVLVSGEQVHVEQSYRTEALRCVSIGELEIHVFVGVRPAGDVEEPLSSRIKSVEDLRAAILGQGE